MSQSVSAPLQIMLLGRFQVHVDGRVVSNDSLRLRASQQLIKLLALAPSYRLHREQVMAAIWPEHAPQAAVNSLNQALYAARRALALPGEDRTPYLTLRDLMLRLGDPEQVWVDAVAFEQLAQQARQQQSVQEALAALAWYHGDLLPSDPYDAWLDARRAALRQIYRTLVLDLAQWSAGTVDAAAAVATLQQALTGDPTDEELHRALMRIYARAGTRQQAIRQYELLQRALRNDLDLEPEPASQQLYRAILDGRFAPNPVAQAGKDLPDRQLAADIPGQSSIFNLQSSIEPGHSSIFNLQSSIDMSERGPVAASPATLPVVLTSFVGRRRELAEVRRLLANTRLLTIAGAGGSGKTRLALEVARAEHDSWFDGVWLVELAALTDPSLLVAVVAAALGLREVQGTPLRDQILAQLGPRQALLVLDNCEHLIDACARFAEALLHACPQVRMLATSREPLRIGGEVVWLIPSLSLPDLRQPPPTLAEIASYEALQLFVDRATAALAQFRLRPEDIPTLVQVCTRLDGMPLAIELAAAQVPTLTLGQLAVRLNDRFRLLRGGSRTALTRQQTLRAAIDWSHDLLNAQERQLFRRLACFAGGWTLEAAEAVCAGEGLDPEDIVPLLVRLVDTSLVVVRGEGSEWRYELLETMRQYALEQLQQAGEAPLQRERHQAWYLHLALEAAPELGGAQQVLWLRRLSSELDNLRLAMQWTNPADPQDVTWLRLAYALYWFWYLNSTVGEGRAWFERALAQTVPEEQSWARGVALVGSGAMALYQGELCTARSRLDQSIAVLRHHNDAFSLGLALFMTGTVAINQGDYPIAAPLLLESLALFEQLDHWQLIGTAQLHLGDVALGVNDLGTAEMRYSQSLGTHRMQSQSIWGTAQALNNLGEVARYRGDSVGAAAYYRESLALFQELTTRSDVARTLHNLAALAGMEGNTAQATTLFQESIQLFRDWGNRRGIVEGVAGLARLAVLSEQPLETQVRAAALLSFTASYFKAMGAAIWPPDRGDDEQAWAALIARLSNEQLATARARGQALSLEQAIAQAISLL